MITNNGKLHIKRYLAQFVPAIAQSVAFGIGNQAEVVTDTSLQLEVVRNTINLVSYDFANNRLIFRSPIPQDFIGTIYEVALYSLDVDPAAGNYGSQNITTFDSATESWVDPADGVSPPTFTATSTRVGVNSMFHNPAASATMTDALRSLTLDFSGNSSADSFKLAVAVANANTNSVTLKFLTDSANYYSTVITTPVQSSGYKIIETTKGAFTATGTPNWGNITEIQLATNSKASGASSVEFDSLRVEDKDSNDLDYVMVARKVLATPVVSIDGLGQDLEFSLDITV